VGDEPTRKSIEERVTDALVANSTALTNLNASVTNHDREYVEGRRAARENANSMAAKIDNLDRSIAEMKLATEKAESARQAELKRIFDLLGEERRDRRAAVSEGREGERDAQKSERELLRELIKEELGERKAERAEHRDLFKLMVAEVWKVGGRYIVAALALLFLVAVMKLTGTNLADIIGLAGK